MTNMEFRIGLRMAMEAMAQEKVDNQIRFMNRSGQNQIRLEILRELQDELSRVQNLDTCSTEYLPWWMGNNYSIERLWAYMPNAFRCMFRQDHSWDMRSIRVSADVDDEIFTFEISE